MIFFVNQLPRDAYRANMKFFVTFCSLFIFVSSFDGFIDENEEWNGESDPFDSNDQGYNLSIRTTMFKSGNDLHFSKRNFKDGFNIIYDCSLDFINEGHINVNDNAHPGNMISMTVENCKNISLYNSPQHSWDRSYKLQNLIIKNVSVVNIRSDVCRYFLRPLFISISNVENLMLDTTDCTGVIALHLKNVGMKEFRLFHSFSDLKMNHVKIENIAAYLKNFKPTTAMLTIKNSHFENVESRGFFIFNSSLVEFRNNTFNNLESEALTVEASQEFIFSDNYVKAMKDSFNVSSPRITITGNTFEYEENSIFSNLIVRGQGIVQKVLNVSRNTMYAWPEMFPLHRDSRPDLIVIKNNYLQCICGNWNPFQDTRVTSISVLYQILMDEKNENRCANFGNCPTHKLKNKALEVCSGQFVCPESEDPPTTLNDILKLMSLSLDNLTNTLHSLTHELNAMKTSRINLMAAESRGNTLLN